MCRHHHHHAPRTCEQLWVNLPTLQLIASSFTYTRAFVCPQALSPAVRSLGILAGTGVPRAPAVAVGNARPVPSTNNFLRYFKSRYRFPLLALTAGHR